MSEYLSHILNIVAYHNRVTYDELNDLFKYYMDGLNTNQTDYLNNFLETLESNNLKVTYILQKGITYLKMDNFVKESDIDMLKQMLKKRQLLILLKELNRLKRELYKNDYIKTHEIRKDIIAIETIYLRKYKN